MSTNTTMEIFICGKAAVVACLKMRPAALREIFVDERRVRAFTDVRGLAGDHVLWKTFSSGELSQIAGTSAHGGIVARTERPEPAQVRPSMRDEWAAEGDKILFLDGLADASQLASIARVAVICGVSRIIADEGVTIPALTSSKAWSLSGGAFEAVKIYRTESMAGMLRMMSEKFFVLGAVREGGRKINYSKTPTFPGKRIALLLSGDENGVPAGMISRCSYLLHIPEPEGSMFRYSPAELCAHLLPWISVRVKNPGSGFLRAKRQKKQHKDIGNSGHEGVFSRA